MKNRRWVQNFEIVYLYTADFNLVQHMAKYSC
jgi:hypothetical protein